MAQSLVTVGPTATLRAHPARTRLTSISSRRPVPELQVPAVARPRNQLYLDREVADIWRPLAVSGRTQHSARSPFSRDLQLVAIGFEQDRFDQRSNGVHRCSAALLALQRETEAADLLALHVRHTREQQLRQGHE